LFYSVYKFSRYQNKHNWHFPPRPLENFVPFRNFHFGHIESVILPSFSFSTAAKEMASNNRLLESGRTGTVAHWLQMITHKTIFLMLCFSSER
jgi:hypothetical protein